jgi:hypothetical protein
MHSLLKILTPLTLSILLLDLLSGSHAKSQSFNESATPEEVWMMNIGRLLGMQDAMCISIKNNNIDRTLASRLISTTIEGLNLNQPNKSIAVFSAQRSSEMHPWCGSIWPASYRKYFNR